MKKINNIYSKMRHHANFYTNRLYTTKSHPNRGVLNNIYYVVFKNINF